MSFEAEKNMGHWQECAELAAAFRWPATPKMNGTVADRFSLEINVDGSEFPINPGQARFSHIRTCELLIRDTNDPDAINRRCALRPAGTFDLFDRTGFARAKRHLTSNIRARS